MKHTHSDRLDRWLGAQKVAHLSNLMREFYSPVPVAGVPGNVRVMPGGDFTGDIKGGQECSAWDRVGRRVEAYMDRMGLRLNAFPSLTALDQASAGGKRMDYWFQKTNSFYSNNVVIDLFYRPTNPASGSAGAATPGGTPQNSGTTGALPFINPANVNTTHFVGGQVSAVVSTNITANTLLLYDRLFAVAKTMNSTATEAVTGVPTRYTSQTATDPDYIGGNFAFPVATSANGGTAHNWTVCQYTNQAGATKNFASVAGGVNSFLAVMNLPASTWFLPLAAGDSGVKAITQLQCDALLASGTMDFAIGHAIAFLPCPIANLACQVDGIGSGLSLTRIFDNACLSFIEMPQSTGAGTTYSGQITTVSE